MPSFCWRRTDLDHHRAVIAGVLGDAAHRLLERPAQDVDAGLDVAFGLDAVERGDGIDQRDAATRHDAFLDRGAGGAQRILDPVLLLLQLGLGGGADLDDGHAAGELGQPLLQLLAIEVTDVVVSIWALICSPRPLMAASSP